MNDQNFLKNCEELLYDYIDPFEVPGALKAVEEAIIALRISEEADRACTECQEFNCWECIYRDWRHAR